LKTYTPEGRNPKGGVEPRKIKNKKTTKKENTMKAKRIFAILLVVMFLMSAFPMMALATAPVQTGASVNGNTLTITFGTCTLDTASVPPAANFTIVVGAPADLDPEVTNVAVTATTVTLTLDEPIPHDATGVTVAYAGTTLQCDCDDGDTPPVPTPDPVAGFGPLNVTIATPPPLTEEHTGDAGILVPTITYDQIRQATLPTSASNFNFILDPQGLAQLTNAQIADLVVEPIPGGYRLGDMFPTGPVLEECTVLLCPDHGTCTEADCEDHVTGGSTTCPLNGVCDEERELEWGLLPDAGQIIFSQYRPHFINNSNFDVALEIEFSFDDDNGGDTVATVATPGAVTTGEDPQVYLSAKFSQANVHTPPGAVDPVGDLVMPILDTAKEPVFLLSSATYTDEIVTTRTGPNPDDPITSIVVEQKKTGPTAATGNGTQFMLVGQCNPNADWRGITASDLSIDIKFTLTTPADTTHWEFTSAELVSIGNVGAAIPGAHGLRIGNGLTAAHFIDTSDDDDDDPIPAPGFTNPLATGGGRAFTRDIGKSPLASAPVQVGFDLGTRTIDRIETSGGVEIPAADYNYVTSPNLALAFVITRMNTLQNNNPVGATMVWNIFIVDDPVPYVLTWRIV